MNVVFVSCPSGVELHSRGAVPGLFSAECESSAVLCNHLTQLQVPFLFFLPGGSGCLDWPLKHHTSKNNHTHAHTEQSSLTQLVSVTHPFFKR